MNFESHEKVNGWKVRKTLNERVTTITLNYSSHFFTPPSLLFLLPSSLSLSLSWYFSTWDHFLFSEICYYYVKCSFFLYSQRFFFNLPSPSERERESKISSWVTKKCEEPPLSYQVNNTLRFKFQSFTNGRKENEWRWEERKRRVEIEREERRENDVSNERERMMCSNWEGEEYLWYCVAFIVVHHVCGWTKERNMSVCKSERGEPERKKDEREREGWK